MTDNYIYDIECQNNFLTKDNIRLEAENVQLKLSINNWKYEAKCEHEQSVEFLKQTEALKRENTSLKKRNKRLVQKVTYLKIELEEMED